MKFFIDNKRILDEHGREIIFKGINICYKKPNPINDMKESEKILAPLCVEHGLNIVRLGITWAAIEPERHHYNKKVINQLKRVVSALEKSGIYVLLDMHQDLYTRQGKHGDGAPKWTIADDVVETKPIAIWAEGYFYMDSVQREFNDFWTNARGIQDDFIAMWKHLANEMNQFDNIIGYDFLNEPFIHRDGRRVFLNLVEGLLDKSLGERIDGEQFFKENENKKGFKKLVATIVKTVKTPARARKMFSDFADYDTFSSLVMPSQEITDEFNREYYQPFFDRMKSAVGTDRLKFFEHNYFSNMGIPFDIKTSDGDVYSPHAYDIFIDTYMYNYSSPDRIRFILNSIKDNQDRMNVPIVFGEWGGSCRHGRGWLDHIDYVYSFMEQNKWGNIYWSYLYKIDRFVDVMKRPYPMAICGTIDEYHSDSTSRIFRLKWTQDREYSVPSLIYTPDGVQEINGKIGANEIEIRY